MTIKFPPGISSSSVDSLATPTAPEQKKSENISSTPKPQDSPSITPEAFKETLRQYKQIKDRIKKPFISGALGLFTENLFLLDPHNPANDPKYLHLLAAVLGLEDVEDLLSTSLQRIEREEGEGGEEDEEESEGEDSEKEE